MRDLIAPMFAVLLGACSSTPEPQVSAEDEPNRWPRRGRLEVALPEAAPNELAVVINNNAMGGSHAGLFIGARLSDPSGNYVSDRSAIKGWRGPSLRDYVDYQMNDGDDVRVYRFLLEKADHATIDERVRIAGATAPLFCAAAVQNQIAGVGPFTGVAPIWWTSPAAVAQLLDSLLATRVAGNCQRADGTRC